MRLLELFSRTGSVGDVANEIDVEVVSLDRDMEATVKTDILYWDYTVYPQNYFDIIWASPPCSIAKTAGFRNIDMANTIVLKKP